MRQIWLGGGCERKTRGGGGKVKEKRNKKICYKVGERERLDREEGIDAKEKIKFRERKSESRLRSRREKV